MRLASRSQRRGRPGKLDPFDDVLRHGRRDASLAAVVAAIILTSSVAWSTVSAHAASAPLPIQDMPSEPTWSADVPGGSGNSGPAFSDGLIFAPTARGVASYPRRCEDPCEPLWRSELPRDWIGYHVDAGSGHVVVNRLGDGMHVFAADCADRGRVCSPAWSKAGRVTDARVVGSSVVATISKREGTRVAVYPLACSDPCAPVWTRLLRADYPSYSLSLVANGTIYVRRGSVMWGVSLGCATGTGRCAVVFRVGHVPDATFPAVTPDQVIFGSGRGAESSEVVAYPTGCGHDCVPLWTGDAGGYVGDAPTVAGDVVVTHRSGGSSRSRSRVQRIARPYGSPRSPAIPFRASRPTAW